MLQILPPLLIGLAGGVTVNYLADVLPFWRRLVWPACRECGNRQPLGNYFMWPRRCPHCNHPHRKRSVLVDISMVIAAIWLWREPPDRLGFAVGYLWLVFLFVVLVIDLEHRLILHPVSLVGTALAFGIGVWQNGLTNTLIGGLVGFGSMLLLYYFGTVFTRLAARLRGEMIDEVALGFGDVNLSGVLGLFLGWPLILIALLLGVLAGGIFSFIYMLGMLLFRRYRGFEALPYAPYLIFGAALLVYFPETARNLLSRISPFLTVVLSR